MDLSKLTLDELLTKRQQCDNIEDYHKINDAISVICDRYEKRNK